MSIIKSSPPSQQYTEDQPSASDPIGQQLIARRRDTLSTETSSDGDVTALNSTAKGELYVKHEDNVNIAGQLDDVATTLPSEDESAEVRITPYRAVHVNVRNNAGTEMGTLANPFYVNSSATGGSTDVKIFDSTGNQINNGQQTMANSVPVVVASNQSAIPVSVTGFPTSTDTNYGTVGVNTLRTASQIGNSTGAADFNSGVTTSQTLRAVLATDQTSIPVTQSGTWNINNITGIISLPTGASTSALQTTGNTSLSSIDGKLNSLGQKTMSGSVPIVIASDQSTLPVSVAAATAVLSTVNSTSTPLTGGSTFTGSWELISSYTQINVDIFSDKSSATSGINFDFSSDASTVDFTTTYAYDSSHTTGDAYILPTVGKYFRVRYTNGASAQTTFRLNTYFQSVPDAPVMAQLNTTLTDNNIANLTRSVIAGVTTGGGGGYVNVKVTPSGALNVAATQDTSPWVISGTVTANIGTTGGLALDTTVSGLQVTQGSTTSGQSGPLIQGAVTTLAPAYTNGQTSPLSLTTGGRLRVDLSQYGGSTTSLGQKTMASSMPVVIASDQTAVPASQSGNWSTRTQDGSGNNITSTSNALDINLKTSSITLPVSGTVGTKTPLTPSSPTSVNVGVVNIAVVAANSSRKGLVLTNLSSATVSFGLGATAVLNQGITLYPGGVWTMDEYTFTTAAINGIASIILSTVAIQEFT